MERSLPYRWNGNKVQVKEAMPMVNDVGLTVLHGSSTAKGELEDQALTSMIGPGRRVVESHELDIVFVHGLMGHPKKTWTTKASPPDEVFWPYHLLPQIFPRARITTWGYDVRLSFPLPSGSHASLLGHSRTLLEDLAALRPSASSQRRPIILIGHSLGGILIKDALSIARTLEPYKSSILDATKGVIFLGTPHRGSNVAAIGNLVAHVLGSPLATILGFIKQNSESLERVERSFHDILDQGQIKVHSFQEELPYNGIMVVPFSCSTVNHRCETISMLHANHRDMARMESMGDVKFQRLSAVLVRWLDELTQTPGAKHNAIGLTEQYEACLNSLGPPDDHRFHSVEKAFTGTYDWLFEEDVSFVRFLRGEDDRCVFWIQGKPASGKSTVMKYALQNAKTLQALRQFHPDPWVFVRHFFHDRGTTAQKSLNGFLRTLLRQILVSRKAAFPYVYPTLSISNSLGDEAIAGDYLVEQHTDIWSNERLITALHTIGERIDTNLNLCVFVDALDEVQGAYADLIHALEELEAMAKNEAVRLRVCTASRPENLFRTKFVNYPSFAIHEHTTRDIELYTESRMRHGAEDMLTEAGRASFNTLIESIIHRANGVFLWVKLVVDELVEALEAGDTPSEMEALLSLMPDELFGLYTRAIRRPRRSVTERAQRNRNVALEAYILFQLVVYADVPFDLLGALWATSYLAMGKELNDLSFQSRRQLEYRLNGLSYGLLEAIESRGRYAVQFMHQTAREFVTGDEGRAVICEHVLPNMRDPGEYLMLRFASRCIPELACDRIGIGYIALVYLVQSAQASEIRSGRYAGQYIETELLKLTAEEQSDLLTRLIDHSHTLGQASSFILDGDDRWSQVLTFYVLCGLNLSLRRCLELPEDSDFVKVGCAGCPSHLTLRQKYRLLNAVLAEGNATIDGPIDAQWAAWEKKSFQTLNVLLEKCFGAGCKPLSRSEAADWAPSFYRVVSSKKLSRSSKIKLWAHGWTFKHDEAPEFSRRYAGGRQPGRRDPSTASRQNSGHLPHLACTPFRAQPER